MLEIVNTILYYWSYKWYVIADLDCANFYSILMLDQKQSHFNKLTNDFIKKN